MNVYNHFSTPIHIEEKKEFLKSSIKATDKIIKNAIKRDASLIKESKGFGLSHHSGTLLKNNNFIDLINYIGQTSWNFLFKQGYDMNQYKLLFTDFWVQEFSKNGGGHQNAHQHQNQHVSGFYFLKCSKNTSHPVFLDPRPAANMTKLKLKENIICYGSETVHFYPEPGNLLIFPSYLLHEFTMDHGKEPFRFIHFNIQAVPSNVLIDN